MKSKCYLCEKDLTSANQSIEHVIINAAGGRLKSKDLLCSTCNALLGDSIDASLAKQISSIAALLMIKRERGVAPKAKGRRESTGEHYLFNEEKPELSAPVVRKETNSEGVQYSIKAKNSSELTKILSGISKRFPQFNVQDALKSAKYSSEFMNEGLQFDASVGGEDVFRAICKCAVNFYILKGGIRDNIAHLLDFLRSRVYLNVVWMHYKDGIYSLNSDESFHTLHLVGSSKERILYCYVDLFNTYKYIVILNDQYADKDIVESYCFDVLNRKEIQKQISIDYSREEVLGFFNNKDAKPFKKVEDSYKHTLNLISKIHFRIGLDKKILEVAEKSVELIEKGGDSEIILNQGKEEIESFIRRLSRKK